MILRRAFLLCLVLASGCASLEEQCDMAGVWQQDQIASKGDIRLKWEVVSNKALPGYCNGTEGLYGCADVYPGFADLHLAGEPKFSQTCALAMIGHEVVHAMGATHFQGR